MKPLQVIVLVGFTSQVFHKREAAGIQVVAAEVLQQLFSYVVQNVAAWV